MKRPLNDSLSPKIAWGFNDALLSVQKEKQKDFDGDERRIWGNWKKIVSCEGFVGSMNKEIY